jgi:hypothetical protein
VPTLPMGEGSMNVTEFSAHSDAGGRRDIVRIGRQRKMSS